jgi:hypothetical protein
MYLFCERDIQIVHVKGNVLQVGQAVFGFELSYAGFIYEI